MARTGLHSREARRYVRIAQLAGLGLGVTAVAMWAMDLRWLSRTLPARPEPGKWFEAPDIVKEPTKPPTIESDAPLGMQERLDQAVKRAKPVAEVKPTDNAEPVSPPPPPSNGPEWRYLGRVLDSDRTLALVSIDGGQKFVPKGAIVAIHTLPVEGRPGTDYKAKVLEIEPEFITIKVGPAESRKIALEAQTAYVSWVKNIPVAAASAPTLSSSAAPVAALLLREYALEANNLAATQRSALRYNLAPAVAGDHGGAR